MARTHTALGPLHGAIAFHGTNPHCAWTLLCHVHMMGHATYTLNSALAFNCTVEIIIMARQAIPDSSLACVTLMHAYGAWTPAWGNSFQRHKTTLPLAPSMLWGNTILHSALASNCTIEIIVVYGNISSYPRFLACMQQCISLMNAYGAFTPAWKKAFNGTKPPYAWTPLWGNIHYSA